MDTPLLSISRSNNGELVINLHADVFAGEPTPQARAQTAGKRAVAEGEEEGPLRKMAKGEAPDPTVSQSGGDKANSQQKQTPRITKIFEQTRVLNSRKPVDIQTQIRNTLTELVDELDKEGRIIVGNAETVSIDKHGTMSLLDPLASRQGRMYVAYLTEQSGSDRTRNILQRCLSNIAPDDSLCVCYDDSKVDVKNNTSEASEGGGGTMRIELFEGGNNISSDEILLVDERVKAWMYKNWWCNMGRSLRVAKWKPDALQPDDGGITEIFQEVVHKNYKISQILCISFACLSAIGLNGKTQQRLGLNFLQRYLSAMKRMNPADEPWWSCLEYVPSWKKLKAAVDKIELLESEDDDEKGPPLHGDEQDENVADGSDEPKCPKKQLCDRNEQLFHSTEHDAVSEAEQLIDKFRKNGSLKCNAHVYYQVVPRKLVSLRKQMGPSTIVMGNPLLEAIIIGECKRNFNCSP